MNTTEFDWLRQINSVSKHIRNFMEVLDVPSSPRPPAAPSVPRPTQPAVLTPRVDMYATIEGLFIEVEVPGTTRDQISLTYEEGRLQIRGTVPARGVSEDASFLSERASGSFVRTIELPREPRVDLSSISARYVQGILTIAIPFVVSSPTSIPIN